MQSIASNIETGKTPLHPSENGLLDCPEILQRYGLDYVAKNHYLEVGNIPPICGWILHISVIRLQFTTLLKQILPEIISADVPFKIPKDKATVKSLLTGNLGLVNIGKIISIYSQDINTLIHLARILIGSTADFRGPIVPAALHLGGCVYTQLDNYRGIEQDDQNNSVPCIDHPRTWPFVEIMPLPKEASKPLLNNRYKGLSVIKPDPKGRVIQANYFKSLFNIKMCIIKEGVKNMWADEFGRDIVDRIKWQYELYTHLEGFVTTPKIFDCFEEQGNIYLTMDFIKGDSFNDIITATYGNNSWFQLSTSRRIKMAEHFIKILLEIKKLHEEGYIHRDITPANFIIDKKGQVHLIDMELTYSLTAQKPNPPFKLGTPGFMSPEQRLRQSPTLKEDIFAIGAFMVYVFCGIYPSRIDISNEKDLFDHLAHFTDNDRLIHLIIKCISVEPENRPELSVIIDFLEKYKLEIQTFKHITPHKENNFPDQAEVNSIINTSIRTFVTSDMLSKVGIWVSPQNPGSDVLSFERTPKFGFLSGIAGILFLLGKAARLGYEVEPCIDLYASNYEYLITQTFNPSPMQDASLFDGTAGLALAIREGILGGLMTRSMQKTLDACFSHPITDRLDLAFGLAGQGISLLRCRTLVTASLYETRLGRIVEAIVSSQQKNGSWCVPYSNRKHGIYLGISHGAAGILCFLIAYCELYRDDRALTALKRGLHWLIKQSRTQNGNFTWPIKAKGKHFDMVNSALGMPGMALTFIRAYTLLNDPAYKTIAENTLHALPKQPLCDDYTSMYGLAGMGEIYLDACTVFPSEEWSERLNWITQSFVHTFLKEKTFGYWALNANTEFSIDLMTGISGILHFLIRAQHLSNKEHILLGN